MYTIGAWCGRTALRGAPRRVVGGEKAHAAATSSGPAYMVREGVTSEKLLLGWGTALSFSERKVFLSRTTTLQPAAASQMERDSETARPM